MEAELAVLDENMHLSALKERLFPGRAPDHMAPPVDPATLEVKLDCIRLTEVSFE